MRRLVGVGLAALLGVGSMGTYAQDFDPDYTGTYSIIGLDPATGELGMAVQSKAFAVGNRTITGKGGLVVVAHQASSNPLYGAMAVQLIQAGMTPEDALAQIVRSDEMRDRRQVAVIDIQGRTAAWTGSGASDWKGHTCGANFCAQGNTLAGPPVVDEMAKAFTSAKGSLAERLVAALDAAQAVGGDHRGMQGAAVTIFKPLAGASGFSDRMIDLRVDDHRTPLVELRRLLDIYYSGQMITEGNAKVNDGDVAGGLAILEDARNRSMANDNAWIALASGYVKAGRTADALKALEQALTLNPSAARAIGRNANFETLRSDPAFTALLSR